jgi:hypothetical protein
MGYELAALIGAPKALVDLATVLPAARVVDLTGELALLALTKPVCAQVSAMDGPAHAQPVRGFRKLTGHLARLAAERSKAAPLLYVEAETFGGPGSQAAIAWRDGRQSWGPVLTQDPGEGRDEEGFVTAQLHVGVPPTCRGDRTRTLHDAAPAANVAPGLLGR